MAKLYRENQKFNQWWVWLIMLATMFLSIGAGIMGYLENGDIWGLVIGGGVGAATAILFALMTLTTTISTEGVEVRFRPFHRRRIFKSEIEEAYVRKYNALGEYGGWGIRFGSKGKAYNVSGNHGLQLKLKDGESILIGTQNPEALEELMVGYLQEDTEPGERLDLDPLTVKEKVRREDLI